MRWLDTHCHLDADSFAPDRDSVRAAARAAGVALCVYPAVERANWSAVQTIAHQYEDTYALGIHPLYVLQADERDLAQLAQLLAASITDPRLVAVGEIGLDLFVPELKTEAGRARQEQFFVAQLKLAQQHMLPTILHSRHAADRVLKYLRRHSTHGGIAHAFNGSMAQAKAFIDLGFKLGFGGALTYERALHLQELARALPIDAIVLETDAPDIPPHWLYKTQAERATGALQGRNSPTELPRIAQILAQLRGIKVEELAESTWKNSLQALPKMELKVSKSVNVR